MVPSADRATTGVLLTSTLTSLRGVLSRDATRARECVGWLPPAWLGLRHAGRRAWLLWGLDGEGERRQEGREWQQACFFFRAGGGVGWGRLAEHRVGSAFGARLHRRKAAEADEGPLLGTPGEGLLCSDDHTAASM